MSSYANAMGKYFNFSDRSSRSEYWMFVLFVLIFFFVGAFFDGFFGTFDEVAGIGLISGIVVLIHIIPGIAVSVRRIHDFDTSGWLYLVSLIPLVGLVFSIVIGCVPGTEGPNRFGPPVTGNTPPMPGHPMPGQPAPGHPMHSNSMPNNPMPNNPMQGNPMHGGPAQNPVGAAPQTNAPQSFMSPPPVPAPDAATSQTSLEKLQRIGELRQQGVLSEAEFEKMKQELIRP